MWRRYLRFWRSQVDADVDDELRFHFETRVEDLLRSGLSADAARAQALAEFGDVRATRAGLAAIDRRVEARRARHLWWDAARQDLRFVLRQLRRSPGTTLTLTLTIALGIGAAVSMYGVMRLLLVAPPPHVAEPERLVRLFRAYTPIVGQPGRVTDRWAYPDYRDFAQHSTALAAVTAVRELDVVVGSGAQARRVRGAAVSAGFATTLGVRPALGRFFTGDEADPVSGARRIVLGHAFWRRAYDGDPAVVGRSLRVKGQPYEIIGVAPRGFRGVGLSDIDVWLPLFVVDDGEASPSRWYRFGGSGVIAIIGRLRAMATAAKAGAEATQLVRAALDERFRSRPGRPVPIVTVTAGSIVGAVDSGMQMMPEARVSVWLVAVGVVLLLVACANVAGLLLLRALRRRRELAVRAALGQSRARLVWQLLLESAVVAMAGGVAALGVVVFGGGWLHRLMLPAMAWEPASAIDGPMATATLIAVLATAAIAGLAPLLHARHDPIAGLREGPQHGTARRSVLHTSLLLSQAALSVVLLVGAGLFARSLHALRDTHLGLDPDRVLAVTMDFSGTGRTTREILPIYERALERVRTLPGVQQAALAVSIPLRSARGAGLYLPGHDSVLTLPGQGSPLDNYVSPGFFATTGTRIVAGRDFTPAERTSTTVVIVNETMARYYWPGRSAIGQCVQRAPGGPCGAVVGVVEDARLFNMVHEERSLFFYRPLDPADPDDRALLVRVAPTAVAPMQITIRRALQEIEPDLEYADISTLQSTLDPQMRPWRLGASVFGAFALLAVVLAAVGLFAAVAFAVTQRTKEIGVRLAIGARSSTILRLVVWDGVMIGLGGAALGSVVAFVTSRFLRSLLYGVSPHDVTVFAAVAVGMPAVAVVASLVPAWRAMRIDPVIALRAD